jgi:hypothetical protein
MTPEVFERILYEEESTTLDFKRQQYRFAKASDDEKSELLKDILGFANAWRRSEAYIVIGVEEVRGGRANVIGIPAADHLSDHSLQQFVNSSTNRPVRFQYEAFGFENKQVGIIRIEQQHRPLYLKKDFGKLKRNEVYVRRGSSTDPSTPAGPDEVAQMGTGGGPAQAELKVEFASAERDEPLAEGMSFDTEFCDLPTADDIPDLDARQRGPSIPGLNLAPLMLNSLHPRNRNYFREMAAYEFTRRVLRPVRIVVKNTGEAAAKRVRVELAVDTASGSLVVDDSDIPPRPQQSYDIANQVLPATFRSVLRRDPGEIAVRRKGSRIHVEVDCGDLQPGRHIWSDALHVGRHESGKLSLQGLVLAENLPQPKDVTLTLNFNVKRTRLSVADVLSLSDDEESN